MSSLITPVTVDYKSTATTIGFLPHPSEPNRFVPVLDGKVVVKAPSLRGHALVGSLLPAFTQANERTAIKALRKLNSGAWAPVEGLLTKTGNFRKGFEALASAASEGLKVAREGRKVELEAARAERNAVTEAAKAEKAAAKLVAAAAAPVAPKAPRARKGGSKKVAAPAVAGDAGIMRLLNEIEAVRAHLTSTPPMPVEIIALAYGVDAATVLLMAGTLIAEAPKAANG
jgi:hypothetical protein